MKHWILGNRKSNTWHQLRYVLMILCTFLIISCDSNLVYDNVKEVPGESWRINDTLRFVVEVVDTISPNDIYFNLHHSIDYSFSNLYVFMSTTMPGGKIYKDTMEFILADKEGRWLGKGISKLKFSSFLIGQNKVFNSPGNYIFDIQHAMRVDELPAIRDVGIKLKKSKL